MSVLFLPPSAGAASVPDASETVSGKIRIATSAEATAGTNDLTAMTPAKTKSVVDAAVVGGVTYQGTFDASAPADLSNAEKGDLYIISVAGTYQGQTWAVGDHLLINADMGGTLDPAKIDKVDNTDSVTSVAGRTGAVTLSTADISGLATVASTGAYSDLTGAPTLATVATTGAYSDLSGTPSLATVATTGAYSDLTGTPTLATVATTGAYSDLTGTPTLGTAAAEDVGTLAGNVVQLDGSARLPAVDGSQLTNLPSGASTLGALTDVDVTGAVNTNVLKYNSTSGNWEDGAVAYAEVTGTPTLATVATTGAYSDLSGTPSLATVATTGAYSDLTGTPTLATVATTGAYSDLTGTPTLGTAAAEDVGTSAGNVVQLDGTAKLPAVDGSQLTNLPTGGFTYQEQSTNAFSVSVTDSTNNIVMCSILGTNTTVLPASSGVADGTVVTLRAAIGTTLSVSGGENLRNLTGTLVSSVVIESGQNMSFVRGSTSSFGTYWNQLTAEEGTLNSLYDVKTAGAVATNVLKYDGTDWVDGAVAYSEVTGTPTLATVATTGAYSDLTGTPTLGTAAAEDVGTSAGNVVQLDGSARLPAVDGSQLTNLPSGASTLGALTDVDVTGAVNTNVLKYNSTSGNWEDGAVAYSEVTGTPTLATVATTGAYSDLTGTPTLGTAAALDVGTSANNVVQLNGSAQLPAVDGSLLTGVSGSVAALDDIGDVTITSINNGDALVYNSTSGDWENAPIGQSPPSVSVSSPSADVTLSAPLSSSVIQEIYIYSPTTAIAVNLVAASTLNSGFIYQIKNRTSNAMTITPNGSETIDGAASYVINISENSVTLVTDGSNWFIV